MKITSFIENEREEESMHDSVEYASPALIYVANSKESGARGGSYPIFQPKVREAGQQVGSKEELLAVSRCQAKEEGQGS